MSSEVVSRSSVRGIAVGLALMALFTAMWSGWAYSASGGWFVLLAAGFWIAAGLMAANSVHLFRSLRLFAPPVEVESEEGRPAGRRFRMVFVAEGVSIGVVCGVLGAAGRSEYFAPAIALIVGLHFIPLAWVFHRRLDIWLGSFAVLVGAVGIFAITARPDSYLPVWAVVGFLMASTTTAYGALMSAAKQNLLRSAAAITPMS